MDDNSPLPNLAEVERAYAPSSIRTYRAATLAITS